jgi:hypothetical protein
MSLFFSQLVKISGNPKNFEPPPQFIPPEGVKAEMLKSQDAAASSIPSAQI